MAHTRDVDYVSEPSNINEIDVQSSNCWSAIDPPFEDSVLRLTARSRIDHHEKKQEPEPNRFSFAPTPGTPKF